MRTLPLLCRTAVGTAAALALTPPAFALDFIFSTGTYVPGTTAPEPLVAGNVLQINSGGNKFFDSATLTNQSGLVNWNADPLYMQSGAVIDNQSVWDAKGDNSLVSNGGAGSTFNNSGTFRKSGGLGTTSIGTIGFVNSGTIDAQTGTISFSGGNATFNAGSQFAGAGLTIVSSNATFNGAFTSSNLSLTGASFTGVSAKINGSVSFTGGTFAGTWELAGGQTLNAKDGAFKFLDAVAFTNNGTVQWQTGDTLYMQSGASFTNNALHDIQATSAIAYNGGAGSAYINSGTGTFRVAAGQTATIGTIGFVNNGGTLTANGTLIFSGASATFNNGTLFNGSGTNVVSNNATFNGTTTSANLELRSGIFTGGTAAVLAGTTAFTGGTFAGTWELAGGQTLNAKDGAFKFLDAVAFTNNGTLQWQTGEALYMQSGASFTNNALHDVQATSAIAYNGGAGPAYINSSTGTLRVAAGQTATIGTIGFVNNGGTLAANGTLIFSGANATFNNGTLFNGNGTNVVNHNATFNGTTTSANLELRSGIFTGGTAAVLAGTTAFTGGHFAGTWELAGGQTLNAKDGTFKFLDAVAFTNKGTVQWQTGDTLYMQSGASFDNRELFDIQESMALVYNGGAAPSFTNNNLMKVAAGKTASIGGVSFINNGTLDVAGTLAFNGNNATFNGGSTFSGAGVVAINSNATFNGIQNSSNLSLRAGTFTGSAAVLKGGAEFSGGHLQGDWTVAGGATLNGMDGGVKFIDAATLTNEGTIAWKTGDALYFQNSANLANKGTIDLQADSAMVYNGGAAGSFVNTGLITKTGGSGTSSIGGNLGFDNQGVINVSTGTIQLPGNFANNGSLQGVGAFATNVLTNAGQVAPGGSLGTLTLNGNYEQTAAGSFDVELASSLLFDTFIINGTAKLDGTLALSCVQGCQLHDNDVFVILDATGELTGTFANVTTLNFGSGFQYDVIYDRDSDLVKLQVIHAGAVPEPGTYALMIAGLCGLGFAARRRV